jgi:hypothetical protein
MVNVGSNSVRVDASYNTNSGASSTFWHITYETDTQLSRANLVESGFVTTEGGPIYVPIEDIHNCARYRGGPTPTVSRYWHGR